MQSQLDVHFVCSAILKCVFAAGKTSTSLYFYKLHFDFALLAFSTRAAKDFHVTTRMNMQKLPAECNTVITICQLRKHTKALSREEHLNAINVIHICSEKIAPQWNGYIRILPMNSGETQNYIPAREIVVSSGSMWVCVILPNQCDSAIRGKVAHIPQLHNSQRQSRSQSKHQKKTLLSLRMGQMRRALSAP